MRNRSRSSGSSTVTTVHRRRVRSIRWGCFEWTSTKLPYLTGKGQPKDVEDVYRMDPGRGVIDMNQEFPSTRFDPGGENKSKRAMVVTRKFGS